MDAPALQIARTVPSVETVSFNSGGRRLIGRLHRPGAIPKAAVVLHGATGVPQRFYQPFAGWLAGQGYACLTYDYRDMGESRDGPLRGVVTTMADWAVKDAAAAQSTLRASASGAPLWVIGHSLGAFGLPFQPEADQLERVIAVASGAVHLSDHPYPYRLGAAALWHGPGLLTRSAFGYLPGRLFGLGEDIPGPAYDQWRRWCTSRGFYIKDIGRSLPAPDWHRVTAHMRFVAVGDDMMCPPASVWRLMQFYPEAAKRQKVLRPSDYGLSQIGHIRVFARASAAVWPDLIADA